MDNYSDIRINERDLLIKLTFKLKRLDTPMQSYDEKEDDTSKAPPFNNKWLAVAAIYPFLKENLTFC